MRLLTLLVFLASCSAGPLGAQTKAVDYLAGNTVLIIRHAEKPATGPNLTAQGENRAKAYATYFEPFHEAGWNVRVDALFAGADSEGSARPRLTLEPLSRATGLKLDVSTGTKDPQRLVNMLRTEPHGRHPLISWRHGQIAALLVAFGASPGVVPGGKWPDEVYDWVVVLQFGQDGRLLTQQLIRESLAVPGPGRSD